MTQELTGGRAAEILLIEDNEDDVMLMRLALKQAKLLINLHHARDGEEGMAFLRKQGEHADAPTPDLILLDLNMPRKDGREVLAEITADDTMRHLAVVVLTTSDEELEILKMYKLRASSYVVKPVDFEQFLRVSARCTSTGSPWWCCQRAAREPLTQDLPAPPVVITRLHDP